VKRRMICKCIGGQMTTLYMSNARQGEPLIQGTVCHREYHTPPKRFCRLLRNRGGGVENSDSGREFRVKRWLQLFDLVKLSTP
jgi:hypothetical protein